MSDFAIAQMKIEIAQVIMYYAHEFDFTPTCWDAVNFCIGYYGRVDKYHIEVITNLASKGILEYSR